MPSFFSLSFANTADGDSRLTALLDTGDFRAECQYWCPPGEFADLVEALKTYPIPTDSPIDMAWYDNCIAIRIEPVDSVGHLAVIVALEAFSSDGDGCRSRFQASYGDLDRFRAELQGLLRKGSGKATLLGS